MSTGEQLFPPRNHDLAVELTARLLSLLDAYGREGDQQLEPGLIRRAGFLSKSKTYTFQTSHGTIVSEWVDMRHFGHGSTFQIDDASHVSGYDTIVIDCYSDDKTLQDTLDYRVNGLTKDQNDAYLDPANSDLLVSLFDPIAHNEKLAAAKPPTRRERRALQKEQAQNYMAQGIKNEMAKGIARLAIARRYPEH